MAKNIVLCSDGTSNSGGTGNATNIWRIFTSIDINGYKEKKIDVEQVAFYDDGVGTQRGKIIRTLSAGMGLGLGRNVRQLYTDLVRNFEPGDHIYLFGFSRGAFTVRTLAGLIAHCGILDYGRFEDDRELKDAVWNVYRAYRFRYRAALSPIWYSVERIFGINRPDDADALRKRVSVKVKASDYKSYQNVTTDYADEHHVPIRFIGAWDTVDAVGFPVDELAEFWNKFIFRISFPTRDLSPYVNKACHALSVDDDRKAYHPVMFDQKKDAKTERIEQVWFSGVHSNVGGGQPKQGLAHVTLNWMIRKAEQEGLVFDADNKATFNLAANEQDALPDARAGLGIYYRYGPRNIDHICQENHIDRSNLHISVFKRIALGTDKYAPGNIPAKFDIEVDNPKNVGESAADQKKLCKAIGEGLESAGEDYRQSGLVEKRMLLHRWFWLATLLVLGYGAVLQGTAAVPTEPQGLVLLLMNLVAYLFNLVPLIGSMLFEDFIRPLFLYPKVGLIVLFLPVVLYIVDYWLKRRQGRFRQRVWRKLLKGGWW